MSKSIIREVAAHVRGFTDAELFDLAARCDLITIARAGDSPAPPERVDDAPVLGRNRVRRRKAKRTAEASKANGATNGVRHERRRTTSSGAAPIYESIEKYVKDGGGVSAGDVAKAMKLTPVRAGAVLRRLRGDGRIFMGGTRRFARYAGSQPIADQACSDAKAAT